MPDIKEKMVELLEPHMSSSTCTFESNDCDLTHCQACNANAVADHLIANGVTIQKWISVEERLPTVEDEDSNETVLAVHKADGFARCWSRIYIVKYHTRFLCWMRTPEPPTCGHKLRRYNK